MFLDLPTCLFEQVDRNRPGDRPVPDLARQLPAGVSGVFGTGTVTGRRATLAGDLEQVSGAEILEPVELTEQDVTPCLESVDVVHGQFSGKCY